ncbi:hypothetical protein, partial [Priestia megaterium]|uniref:hypothetical protein n=1 Tax=Priestia megaterium TaxID=1404 RepID=UPI00387984D2
MLKKYFIALLLLCLVVIEVPINPAFAAVDVTNPTLEGVKLDKKEGKVGDIIHVQVKATDKESGLSNRIYLRYKAPITGKYKSVDLTYKQSEGYYEGDLRVEDTMESGEWQVAWVTLYDNAENSTTVYGPIQGSSFIVKGTSPDVTNPTLESIKLDKKEGKVGDIIHVQVKATDKGSGLSNRIYLRYKAPITGKYKSIDLTYKQSEGYYEGDLRVEDTMESGEWQVAWVTLYDNAENSTTVYGPIQGS